MSTVNLKDAEAGLPELVDKVGTGEFITITRHGKPVAALVPVEAAELARKAMAPRPVGLASYLKTFPGLEVERNPAPSRDVDL